MNTEYIKNLIEINKLAKINIGQLENLCAAVKINNDKDKANFGNACVALRGFRMIADATEAMLINENVLQDDNGNYYKKIEDEPEQVQTPTPKHKDE